jgi:hypothetical protein
MRVGTNGPLNYPASDGLGSVSEALDESGNVTSRQLYDPYGKVRYSSGSSPSSRGYTGQQAGPTTGLDVKPLTLSGHSSDPYVTTWRSVIVGGGRLWV